MRLSIKDLASTVKKQQPKRLNEDAQRGSVVKSAFYVAASRSPSFNDPYIHMSNDDGHFQGIPQGGAFPTAAAAARVAESLAKNQVRYKMYGTNKRERPILYGVVQAKYFLVSDLFDDSEE